MASVALNPERLLSARLRYIEKKTIHYLGYVTKYGEMYGTTQRQENCWFGRGIP